MQMMEFTCDGMVRMGYGFYNPNHAAALICALLPFLWEWFLQTMSMPMQALPWSVHDRRDKFSKSVFLRVPDSDTERSG